MNPNYGAFKGFNAVVEKQVLVTTSGTPEPGYEVLLCDHLGRDARVLYREEGLNVQ